MLARIGESAVPKGRQGVDRRIPVQLLPVLALTLEMSNGLGIPTRDAFDRARSILDSSMTDDGGHRPPIELAIGEFSTLQVDVVALKGLVEARLEAAIESVVRPRRGRPPVAGIR